MKYLNKILFVFALVAMWSCANEDLNPVPPIANGAMVVVDATPVPVYDVTDLANSAYTIDLRSVSNNVTEFRLYGALFRGGVAQTDTALIETVTTFPSTISITTAELIAAWDAITSTDDFQAGDRIEFYNEATRKDGEVFTWENVGTDLGGNAGQRSAFRRTTYVSCPFDVNDAIGTYTVTVDNFGVSPIGPGDYTFEVVAGTAENSIVMQDPYGFTIFDPVKYPVGTYYVTVNVDPNTGQATQTRQASWDVNIYVPSLSGGFSAAPITNASFVFSCTGTIAMRYTYSVNQGTYGGTWTFTAIKN